MSAHERVPAGLLGAGLIQNIAILCADGTGAGRRSEYGRLRHIDGDQGRGDRRQMAFVLRNTMLPVLPSGLEALVDLVVPILQRRGPFPTEHAGKTLRENYGLPRPPIRNQQRALEGVA